MTEPIFLGISSLFVLIFLIIIRIPIAYAMILTGGIGIMSIDGVGTIFNQLKTLAYGQFSNYDLSVVPLFILMGALASRIGLSSALFAAANSWLSWLRGVVLWLLYLHARVLGPFVALLLQQHPQWEGLHYPNY